MSKSLRFFQPLCYNSHQTLRYNYEQARNKRIQKGDCYFKRVVAICDDHDIERLQQHLEACAPGKNYELRIIRGKPTIPRDQPYFDVLVAGDQQALLQIPGLKNGPLRSSAYHITDQRGVMALQEYFYTLWNMAVPLKKESEKIDQEFLDTWMQRLEIIPITYSYFAPDDKRD